MLNKVPYLSFNFTNINGGRDLFEFTQPVDVITAQTIDEIIPALNKIESAIHDGFYAAGYMSYEAAPAFNKSFTVNQNNEMPLLWFGIFNEPRQVDAPKQAEAFELTEWQPNISQEHYNKSIDAIHHYIKEGKTNQVNYTLQMLANFSGDSLSFYNQLKEAQSNFSAYLDLEDFTILSASPEMFFNLEDNILTTRPMKGTIERGKTFAEDEANANWLAQSEKNRLENKMVVELMEEELKAIAQEDSIRVARAYEVEKYPTVYQMTSTLEAKLQEDKNVFDVFNALFPCGSITGSPKENTMNIIDELEVNSREVYCGAIGFITPEQRATFNVPIRTVYINKETNKAKYGVGGAITIESTKEEEYKEVFTKASVLTKKTASFDLLESIRLENGKLFLLDEHLNRLEQSAQYFEYPFDRDSVVTELISVANSNKEGTFKLRLTLTKTGSISIESEEIKPFTNKLTVRLADHAIDRNDLFLYHKTTNRAFYEACKINDDHIFDTLLWNEDREVTEFTIGNVVIEKDGKKITPPISSGLLNGTFRSSLIEQGDIVEATISKDDLQKATNVWLINSVRKWVPVEIK